MKLGGLLMDSNLKLYTKLQPKIEKASSKYFDNFSVIEALWKEIKSNPTQKNKDLLWVKAQEGILLLIEWSNLEKQVFPTYSFPKTMACYKYPIMLLEKEKKWADGINFCKAALSYISTNEWIENKLSSFIEKQQKEKLNV
jgi:hypothetical protein